MTNEMVGVAGVFVLSFLFFLLRHFYLSAGRRDKSRQGTRPAPGRNNELNRLNKKLGEDDAWLLWAPEPDQTDPSNRVHDELAEHRAHAEREGSLSTTMNLNRLRCRMAILVSLILFAGNLQAQQENATQARRGAIPAASNTSTPATTGVSSDASGREQRLSESRTVINTADGSLGPGRLSVEASSSATSGEDAAQALNEPRPANPGTTASDQNRASSKASWQYGGFVDLGYLLDFNHPSNHSFRSRGTTFHVDNLYVNMAGAYAKKKASEESWWGVELTAQAGKDSEVFGFSAPAPNIDGFKWLRHFGPTNVSYLTPLARDSACKAESSAV